MSRESRLEVLNILLDAQEKCAPIELSIGHVDSNNQVINDSIVIKSAPPIVVNKLLTSGYGFLASITPYGFIVDKY